MSGLRVGMTCFFAWMLCAVVASPAAGSSAEAAAPTVLFVIGNSASPAAPDRDVMALLEGSGLALALVDDDSVQASDADAVDSVLISSSVVPSKVGSTFRNSATPLVVWEPFLFSHLAMTRAGGANRGEVAGRSAIDVVLPDHPLAAGLTGTIAVTTSNTGLSWGRAVEQGIVVATIPGASGRATIFVYDGGAQMHDVVAPATRIGLFPSFATGGRLTPEGETMIAAAVEYALGAPVTDPVNTPPTVDAGPDQVLVAPTPTSDVDTFLNATISDDGLPLTPGAVSVHWTGPAGVTFASATSPDSIVTLPGPGTYVLDIEADDGEIVASDSVVVMVLESAPEPINIAPFVEAGRDLSVVYGAPITVTANVSDDGLPVAPGVISVAWSGPAGVVFDLPSSANSGVTVPGPGTYDLTVTAGDGELTTSDSLLLTVDAIESPTPGLVNILYVAQNAAGATGEQAVIQRLIEAGHAVTVVDDNLADPAEAVAFDLVVVSSSISPVGFDAGWAASPTPMIIWESRVADDLGLAANNVGGFVSSQRDIRILDGDHPITAGFDGLVRVTSSARSVAWTKPGGGGRVLASVKSTASKASIYTYEPGDAMETGAAPARRVGLFLSTNSGQAMTDDGWLLFDRAVSWAVAPPSAAPVAAATADVTGGQAPQSVNFDASGSTGNIVSYDWDFGDGTSASGIEVAKTYPVGGTFDVVLSVSDPSGRTATDSVALDFEAVAPGGGQLDPIAAYDFVQGARSDFVDDVSSVGVPLDLRIHDPSNVSWQPGGGLNIESATKLESETSADKVTAAVAASQEITIEAWVDPIDAIQSGPARIVALTNGDEEENDINAMLGQGHATGKGDRAEGRFMTTATTDHGQPGVVSREATIDGDLVHLVFTRSHTGNERIYVNGSLSSEWQVSGGTEEWNLATPLVLANERNETRPWLGSFYRVQIYDRAITPVEVCASSAVGPGRTFAGNAAPSPCLLSDSEGSMAAPHTIRFDSRNSVDLDGSIASRSWDFDDGTTSVADAPNHEFGTPGTYRVTLTVTDDAGASRTATVAVEIDDPAPIPAPTLREASGMRVGQGFFKRDLHESNETWLGRELNWTAQFTSHHSASEMGSSSYGLFANPNAELIEVVERMNVAVSMGLAFGFQDLKNGGPSAVRDGLLDTVNGEFDFLYFRAANRMIEAGYGDAVIRLGHEFNLLWPPWAAAGNEALYIEAFRHVATLFRNVSPDFRFDFSAGKKSFATSAAPVYPGDDFVDVISVSVYWKNADGSKPWSDAKWNDVYARNLQAMRDFAISRGKPVGIAEWGIQGLDEPRFVQAMYDFMQTLPTTGPGHMLYNVYWDSGAATSRLANLPAVKQRYKLLFG